MGFRGKITLTDLMCPRLFVFSFFSFRLPQFLYVSWEIMSSSIPICKIRYKPKLGEYRWPLQRRKGKIVNSWLGYLQIEQENSLVPRNSTAWTVLEQWFHQISSFRWLKLENVLMEFHRLASSSSWPNKLKHYRWDLRKTKSIKIFVKELEIDSSSAM